jgi:hypothetical protein
LQLRRRQPKSRKRTSRPKSARSAAKSQSIQNSADAVAKCHIEDWLTLIQSLMQGRVLLYSPKPIKPSLRNPCVAYRHFNRPMPEPFLDCAQVYASISQSVTARMAKAVRMQVREARQLGGSIDKVVNGEPS